MKKSPKKLQLHRETLARIAGAATAANNLEAAIDTSCGEPCSCPVDTCYCDGMGNFAALR